MKSKSSCSLQRQPQATKALRCGAWAAVLFTLWTLGAARPARAGDAPQWMHALVNVPLPAHDEKTDAVMLYSEEILSVQGNGKIKRTERRVYKILRPDGRKYGKIFADFDSETKINSIHGWCIPAQGKDYEVKDKDALETALFGVQNGELMTRPQDESTDHSRGGSRQHHWLRDRTGSSAICPARCVGIPERRNTGSRGALHPATSGWLGI